VLLDNVVDPIDIDGELDIRRFALARREQRLWRRKLLRGATAGQCGICGISHDAEYLWVAHIKKRSECNETERRNHANLMLACLFGCDSLFENGHITVNRVGIVEINTSNPPMSPDTLAKASAVAGRPCSVHSPGSETFFRWHRDHWS
jgi:hypothetical protein